MGWNRAEQSRTGNSAGPLVVTRAGCHGDSYKFKPTYHGLRAFGWKWKVNRLLEHRGHVRPRPLLVVFNSSSAFGSKLHPGASTTNNCSFSYAGSCGGHFHRVPLYISVPAHPSASRDAGVQGRLSQFVSTGILMYVNVLCGLFLRRCQRRRQRSIGSLV